MNPIGSRNTHNLWNDVDVDGVRIDARHLFGIFHADLGEFFQDRMLVHEILDVRQCSSHPVLKCTKADG